MLPAPRALWIAAALLAALAPAARAESPPRMAPIFSVRTLEGKTIRLQDLRGRAVVLDFWATWCQPCKATMPHLDEVQRRYRKDGLVVLGLAVDEDGSEVVRPFAQHLKVSFALGLADEKVLDLYGPIRSIPTTFFIDRQGRVVRRVVGYIDAETVDSYVRELF